MKRVLIIDDEIDLCILLKSYLSRKNCDVYIAHSLIDGIKQLDNISPDVLLLDNNLPDGMGWNEANTMQKKFPMMNITLISAYQMPKDFKATMNREIHILEKPISLHDIDQYL